MFGTGKASRLPPPPRAAMANCQPWLEARWIPPPSFSLDPSNGLCRRRRRREKERKLRGQLFARDQKHSFRAKGALSGDKMWNHTQVAVE